MTSPASASEPPTADRAGPPIRLGVSSCLVGEPVRATGGHCRDLFLLHNLGPWVEWVSVCPEVEMGMPVPRPTIRLVGDAETPRLVSSDGTKDHTDGMRNWATAKLDALEAAALDGYVFKKNSPSCGLFRIRVYNDKGVPTRNGRGLFAAMLTARFPLLPVEEDGRLNDPRLRENFIERVFAHSRLRQLSREDPTPRGLVRFHTGQKLTVMAHSPSHYRELGRLVADAGKRPWDELIGEYGRLFMEALGTMAKPGRHANVLHHIMGFLKDHLDGADRAELVRVIEDYRQGMVPLVVPMTLLNHHLGRQPVPAWVHQQTYLSPYPRELMLRNHV